MFGKVEYDSLLDAFKCEICGAFVGGLSHHISGAHKITVVEYRRRFGLNKNTALITKSEIEKHRKRAIEGNAFGKLSPQQFNRFKKGDNTRQKYKRSAETKLFLSRDLSKRGRNKIRANRFKRRSLTKPTISDTI